MNKIVIPLKGIPSLNEHDNANRANRFSGASMKKNATNLCAAYVKQAMNKGFVIKEQPADLKIVWYAENRRKDKDNIAFAVKYIFDGMVNAGLISNDGWQQIGDWENAFEIDKEDPRVEIIEKRKLK